ncbi:MULTISPECIES: hypothetical protein [Kocuria]|uniref:Uncharacterized protein n=1 Tax=Kocuria flava TaxID=446860 RepID=A0A2N4T115_9MICC|nr:MULTISPECIES: hypothetical protein [Kocuria]PLC11927.1 hypothetical protein AUQ48_06360 [Kocuria flava]STX05694.1 Uncharacterised protein [Kocuria rosea]
MDAVNTSRPEATPSVHQQRQPPQGFAAVLPLLVGSTVGAAGGSTFVLANASALGPPWPGLALGAWGVLALGWLAATLLHRHEPSVARPRRHALTIYVGSVVAMLVLIRLATTALGTLEAEHLRPAAIAVAVGLHFLPFAWAFPATSRLFGVLGAVVATLGGAGLLLGLFVTPTAGAAAAVLAGLTMVALITLYNLRH